MGRNALIRLGRSRVLIPARPCRVIGAQVLSDCAWREIARSLHLSRRELQIVRATFDDTKEIAIAHDLGISPRTVHTHIERLHRKLRVSDRLQLALRVFEEFLQLTRSTRGHLPPICAYNRTGNCPWQA